MSTLQPRFTDVKIEVPDDPPPFLDQLLSVAKDGSVIYLMREGRPIAAFLPVELTESSRRASPS